MPPIWQGFFIDRQTMPSSSCQSRPYPLFTDRFRQMQRMAMMYVFRDLSTEMPTRPDQRIIRSSLSSAHPRVTELDQGLKGNESSSDLFTRDLGRWQCHHGRLGYGTSTSSSPPTIVIPGTLLRASSETKGDVALCQAPCNSSMRRSSSTSVR